MMKSVMCSLIKISLLMQCNHGRFPFLSGDFFAYGVSQLGGDYSTLYVLPTSSLLSQASVAQSRNGRLADGVKWTKFSSIMWMKDFKGFLYYRPNVNFMWRNRAIEIP